MCVGEASRWPSTGKSLATIIELWWLVRRNGAGGTDASQTSFLATGAKNNMSFECKLECDIRPLLGLVEPASSIVVATAVLGTLQPQDWRPDMVRRGESRGRATRPRGRRTLMARVATASKHTSLLALSACLPHDRPQLNGPVSLLHASWSLRVGMCTSYLPYYTITVSRQMRMCMRMGGAQGARANHDIFISNRSHNVIVAHSSRRG